MAAEGPGIVILDRRIERGELARLVDTYFEDMVKYVADVTRGVIAIGGELHADAEQILLEAGSRQADRWGANDYPGRGRDGCIEFTALIDIRPARSGSLRVRPWCGFWDGGQLTNTIALPGGIRAIAAPAARWKDRWSRSGSGPR